MRYELQKYRTVSDRHTCPKCGKPKCFTYYVDANGHPLDTTVGRCDHESGCGYHYPPKEYFKDNPELKYQEKESACPIRADRPKTPGKPSGKTIGTIPYEYVSRSRSDNSHLIQFLLSLQEHNAEQVRRVLDDYRIGATKDGSTIFWQIDSEGRVRTGKIIRYNREDGHRIKDNSVNWVHSLLKKRSVVGDEWTLTQCLFGEHLLSQAADWRKVVAVVESEKTALVCAIQYPECVWLATGGKSQLAADKMTVLAGRTVIFYPDVDAYQEWKQRTMAFSFCRSVTVSDFLERNATEEYRRRKVDIADLILRQWKEDKQREEDTPLAAAERALQEMVRRNPALQTLIDTLGLVPVVEDG
nr:DUF6371 domain-containing protein [Bacteroides intestinalis]